MKHLNGLLIAKDNAQVLSAAEDLTLFLDTLTMPQPSKQLTIIRGISPLSLTLLLCSKYSTLSIQEKFMVKYFFIYIVQCLQRNRWSWTLLRLGCCHCRNTSLDYYLRRVRLWTLSSWTDSLTMGNLGIFNAIKIGIGSTSLIVGLILKLIPYGFEERDSNIKLKNKEA